MMVTVHAWLIAIILVGQASTIRGRVERVTDGDTIVVRDDEGTCHTIRLQGIDAPELAQPHGARSRDALNQMVGRRKITVLLNGQDRYGRVLAEIWSDDVQSVNEKMVLKGFAWHYVRYARSNSVLATLQEEAQKQRRGIWRSTRPTPPWEWRRSQTPHTSLRSKSR